MGGKFPLPSIYRPLFSNHHLFAVDKSALAGQTLLHPIQWVGRFWDFNTTIYGIPVSRPFFPLFLHSELILDPVGTTVYYSPVLGSGWKRTSGTWTLHSCVAWVCGGKSGTRELHSWGCENPESGRGFWGPRWCLKSGEEWPIRIQ